MSVLQLSSASYNINPITGEQGNIVISQDVAFTGTPSTITLTVQVSGLVPNVDFNMPDFTWVNAGVYWTGTYTINYNDISPTSPLTFPVTPIINSQYGNVLGTFTLVAATGYTVGASYQVNFDLQGNSGKMVVLPVLITFDEALNVGITSMAVMEVANTSGTNYTITTLNIPSDINLACKILVENSNANVLLWDKFGTDISTKTINSGTTKRIAILLNSAIPLDISSWYLNMVITDGNTPAYTETSNYAFESNTVTTPTVGISDSRTKVNIGINSYTWVDGTSKPAITPGACGNLNLGKTLPVTGSATLPIVLKNIDTDSCPDGCTTGNIRFGDMINGWFSSLIQNDNGNVTLPLTPSVSDSGYVVATNASVVLDAVVGNNGREGVHTSQFDFLYRECQNPAVITTTALSNPNTSFSGGNSLPITATPSEDTYVLTPMYINDVIQGYDQATCLATDTHNYDWTGEFSGVISLTNRYYIAPLTRNYSFTVQIQTANVPGAAKRDIAMFINGSFHQLITGIKSNIFVETEITVALNANDQVSFAAYSDAGIALVDYFSVIVRYEEKVNFKPVVIACQPILTYNVYEQKIVTTSAAVNITGQSGSNYTSQITLQNNEVNPEIISGVSITGLSDFTSTGVVFPITIAPGGSYTFYFTWSPLTNYGAVVANVVFDTNIGTYTEGINVNAQEKLISCNCAFSQSLYSVNVTENIQSSFGTLVQFNPGSLTGFLTLDNTSACSGLTFTGGATVLNIPVSAGIPVYIPINILISTCPDNPLICNIPYKLVIRTLGEGQLCTGFLNIQTIVKCSSVTTCPAQFAPSVVDIPNLQPNESGSFSVNFLLSDTVANLGLSVVDFNLPAGESILSFGTLTNIPGKLTWSTISATHIRATLTVPSNNLTFITIPLSYTTASGGTISYTYSSNLSATSTFINAAYSCDVLTEPITLDVVIQPATITGFEVEVTNTEIDICKTIQINDTSTYGSGACFQLNDFTLFRQITIINPDGTTYVMSTYQPYNQLIASAYNSGSPIYSYNYDVSLQGGVYSITLASVPTYNNTCTWNIGDVCCLLDSNGIVQFFEALQINSGVIPLSTPGWQTYWNEITINDLQAPYVSTTFYVNTCALQNCFNNSAQGIFCDFDNICNKNMCEDQCQMNFYKLIIIEYLINMAITSGDYDALTAYYNLATTLCNCIPCGGNNIQNKKPCNK